MTALSLNYKIFIDKLNFSFSSANCDSSIDSNALLKYKLSSIQYQHFLQLYWIVKKSFYFSDKHDSDLITSEIYSPVVKRISHTLFEASSFKSL